MQREIKDARGEKEERQKEGGGTERAFDMVTYREFVLIEAEYNNITNIALRFSIIAGNQMKA